MDEDNIIHEGAGSAKSDDERLEEFKQKILDVLKGQADAEYAKGRQEEEDAALAQMRADPGHAGRTETEPALDTFRIEHTPMEDGRERVLFIVNGKKHCEIAIHTGGNMLKRFFDFLERFVVGYEYCIYKGLPFRYKTDSVFINFNPTMMSLYNASYHCHSKPVMGLDLTSRGKDGKYHRKHISTDRKDTMYEFYKFLIEVDSSLRTQYMDEVFMLDLEGHYAAMDHGIFTDHEREVTEAADLEETRFRENRLKGKIKSVNRQDENTAIVTMQVDKTNEAVYWDLSMKKHRKRYDKENMSFTSAMTAEFCTIEKADKAALPDGGKWAAVYTPLGDGYYEVIARAQDVETDGVYDYTFRIGAMGGVMREHYAEEDDEDEKLVTFEAQIMEPSETHIADGDAVRGRCRLVCNW